VLKARRPKAAATGRTRRGEENTKCSDKWTEICGGKKTFKVQEELCERCCCHGGKKTPLLLPVFGVSRKNNKTA
jgi:hypothetical protein